MSRQDNEKVWGFIVLAAIVFLLVIAIFKIIFWLAVVAILFGLGWIAYMLFEQDTDDIWIPLLVIVAGVFLSIIAYQIGYGLEQTPGGNQTIQLAKTILQIEDTRTELPKQVAQQTITALENVTT